LDINKVIKEVREKTTIEDSVITLIGAVEHEILQHPGDTDRNIDLATQLFANMHELSRAVAENT